MRFLHDGDFTCCASALHQRLQVIWEFSIPHLHSFLSEGPVTRPFAISL